MSARVIDTSYRQHRIDIRIRSVSGGICRDVRDGLGFRGRHQRFDPELNERFLDGHEAEGLQLT